MKTMGQVGLLASGSIYLPRLPHSLRNSGSSQLALVAAFVPGHSDGVRDGFAPSSQLLTCCSQDSTTTKRDQMKRLWFIIKVR